MLAKGRLGISAKRKQEGCAPGHSSPKQYNFTGFYYSNYILFLQRHAVYVILWQVGWTGHLC
jgi:hypothetical protein